MKDLPMTAVSPDIRIYFAVVNVLIQIIYIREEAVFGFKLWAWIPIVPKAPPNCSEIPAVQLYPPEARQISIGHPPNT